MNGALPADHVSPGLMGSPWRLALHSKTFVRDIHIPDTDNLVVSAGFIEEANPIQDRFHWGTMEFRSP